MKKINRKSKIVVSLLMVLVMLFSTIAVTAFATTEADNGNDTAVTTNPDVVLSDTDWYTFTYTPPKNGESAKLDIQIKTDLSEYMNIGMADVAQLAEDVLTIVVQYAMDNFLDIDTGKYDVELVSASYPELDNLPASVKEMLKGYAQDILGVSSLEELEANLTVDEENGRTAEVVESYKQTVQENIEKVIENIEAEQESIETQLGFALQSLGMTTEEFDEVVDAVTELVAPADPEKTTVFTEIMDKIYEGSDNKEEVINKVASTVTDVAEGSVEKAKVEITYIDIIKSVKKFTVDGESIISLDNGISVNYSAILAALKKIPMPGELANYTVEEYKNLLSYNFGIEIMFGEFDIDVSLGLTGSEYQISKIRSVMAIIADHIDIDFTRFAQGGGVTFKLKVPDEFAALLLRAAESDMIPDSIKHKMFTCLDKNGNDIVAFITEDLTVEDIVAVLQSIDYEKIIDASLGKDIILKLAKKFHIDDNLEGLTNEQINAKVAEIASELGVYYNKAMKYVAKAADYMNELYPKVMDKSIADFYVGNGVFHAEEDITISEELLLKLVDKATGVADNHMDEEYDPYLAKIRETLRAAIAKVMIGRSFTVDADVTIEFLDVYQVTFNDGKSVVKGFLPVGADVVYFANNSTVNVWVDSEGTVYNKMPAKDVVLYPVGDLTAWVEYKGEVISGDFVKDYTADGYVLEAVLNYVRADKSGVEVVYEWYKGVGDSATLVGTGKTYKVVNVADNDVYWCKITVTDKDAGVNTTVNATVNVDIQPIAIDVSNYTVAWSVKTATGTNVTNFVVGKLDYLADGYVITLVPGAEFDKELLNWNFDTVLNVTEAGDFTFTFTPDESDKYITSKSANYTVVGYDDFVYGLTDTETGYNNYLWSMAPAGTCNHSDCVEMNITAINGNCANGVTYNKFCNLCESYIYEADGTTKKVFTYATYNHVIVTVDAKECESALMVGHDAYEKCSVTGCTHSDYESHKHVLVDKDEVGTTPYKRCETCGKDFGKLGAPEELANVQTNNKTPGITITGSNAGDFTASDVTGTYADLKIEGLGKGLKGKVILAYDINTNGKFEEGAKYTIVFDIPTDYVAHKNLAIYHIDDNGNTEVITITEIKNGKLTFTATEFSVYALVAIEETSNWWIWLIVVLGALLIAGAVVAAVIIYKKKHAAKAEDAKKDNAAPAAKPAAEAPVEKAPAEEKPAEAAEAAPAQEAPVAEEAAEEAPAEEAPVAEVVEEAPAEEKPAEAVEEAPALEAPVAEVVEEAPAEEAPVAEVVEESPAEEAPVAEAVEEAPVEEAPVDEVVEEAPVEEAPVAESVEEAPALEAPVAEVVEEAPVEEAPVAEVVEEAPAEEAPVAEETAEPVAAIAAGEYTAEEDSVVVNGEVVYVHYRSSFTSRLIQANDTLQDYYTAIKNYILSYPGVKAKTSWNYEIFTKGRTQCVKLNIKGKSLTLNLALDPKEYSVSKYHFTDLSDNPKFAALPMLLKVKSDRGLKYALELIAEVMNKLGIAQGEIPTADYHMPYESNASLAKRGIVKVILPAGVKYDSTLEIREANVSEIIDGEDDKTVTREEVFLYDNDDVAEAEIEEAVAEETVAAEEPAVEAPAEAETVVENTEAPAAAPVIADDSITTAEGNVVLIRYRSSFTSRLIQSEGEIQDYYSALKNHLLSYKGVKSRTSWNYETFAKGRTQCARINLKGKTLTINLALVPESYNVNKYHFTDLSDNPKFDKLPMLLKIRSARALKYAIELIDELMKTLGVTLGKIQNVDYRKPYESNSELARRGLMKIILPAGVKLDETTILREENVDTIMDTHKQTDAPAAVEEAPVEVAPVVEEVAVEETPIVEEVVEETPVEEAVVEEVAEETPVEEAIVEEVVEETPVEEAIVEEVVEETPVEEAIVEEAVEETPVEEAIVEEVVEEAPVEEAPVEEPVFTDAQHADEMVDDFAAKKSIEVIKKSRSGKMVEVNIDDICANFEDGEVVTLDALKDRKLISKSAGRVKVLANGVMTKRLTVEADKFSLQAVKMITLAGGTAKSYT